MKAPSPSWIAQVLDQRGIPNAGREAVRESFSAIPESDQIKLFQTLQALERGTETGTDFERCVGVFRPKKAPPEQIQISEAMVAVKKVGGAKVQADAPRAKPKSTDSGKAYRKWHIYGQTAALTVEITELRRHELGSDSHTLTLEMAEKADLETNDWPNKISFQLTQREVPLLASVLMGFSPRIELTNHGPAANKSLLVEDQGHRLFVQISKPSRILRLAVSPGDVHYFAGLALEVMQMRHPGLDGQMQIALLRRVGDMNSYRKQQ